jgi:hypothetical protein
MLTWQNDPEHGGVVVHVVAEASVEVAGMLAETLEVGHPLSAVGFHRLAVLADGSAGAR